MKRIITAVLSVLSVLAAPATALAQGTSETTFKSIAEFALNRIKSRLVPGLESWSEFWTQGHFWLMFGATALTLTWMLASKRFRHLIGRLGGFALFGIMLDSAWGLVSIAWGIFGSLIGLMLVLAIFSSTVRGMVFSALKWATVDMVKYFWTKSTQVAAQEEPNLGWTLISALVISSLINGATLSNESTHYVPSILSSLLGAGVLGWGLFHMTWLCGAVFADGSKPCRHLNRDWGMNQQRCDHCGGWNPLVDWPCGRDGCKVINPFSVKRCTGCGKPNPHIDHRGKPVRQDQPPTPRQPAAPAHQPAPATQTAPVAVAPVTPVAIAPMANMVYCPQGHMTLAGSRFCRTCGAQIGQPLVAVPPPAVSPMAPAPSAGMSATAAVPRLRRRE